VTFNAPPSQISHAWKSSKCMEPEVAKLVLQRRYGPDDQEIEVPLRAAAFLSSLQCPDGLWNTSNFLPSGWWSSLWGKFLHSPPSSAELKTPWCYTSIPSSAFMYVCLIELKCTEFLLNNKYLVRTWQDTSHVSVTKVKQLIRLRGTLTVYCEPYGTHKHTLWAECRISVRQNRRYYNIHGL
jgi:hypothetical protein